MHTQYKSLQFLELIQGHEDDSHVPDKTWVTDATAPPITYVSSFHEPIGSPGVYPRFVYYESISSASQKKKNLKKGIISRQPAGQDKGEHEGGGARSSKADMECEYWGMLHSGSNFLASLVPRVCLDAAQGKVCKAKFARQSVQGKVCKAKCAGVLRQSVLVFDGNA